jgi:hypothetical protein
MAVTVGRAAGGGFGIATPGDWFALRVPREASDADRVAADAIAAHPEFASHRDILRDLIRGLVKACETLNVIAAYATLLDVPGGPLPASLAITAHPMGGYTLDTVAAEMSAQPGDALMPPPSVGMFDFPAGRTARIERLSEWGAGESRRPVSFLAQYVTEAPGGIAVMLTFSTPALALADQLRPLFHQIAATLRFDPPGAVR